MAGVRDEMFAFNSRRDQLFVHTRQSGAPAIQARRTKHYTSRCFLIAYEASPRQRQVLLRDRSPRSIEMIERHADNRLSLVRYFSRIIHSRIVRQKSFFADSIIEVQGFVVEIDATGHAHIDFYSQRS